MRNHRIPIEKAEAFIASEKIRRKKEEKQRKIEYARRKVKDEKSTGLILAQIERARAVCQWHNDYVFEGIIGDWHFSLCNQGSRIVGVIHFATDNFDDVRIIQENQYDRRSNRLRELYGYRNICYDGKVPAVYYEFLNRLIHDETELLKEIDKQEASHVEV